MADFDSLSDSEINARLENRHVPEQDRKWAVKNRDFDPQAREFLERELG